MLALIATGFLVLGELLFLSYGSVVLYAGLNNDCKNTDPPMTMPQIRRHRVSYLPRKSAATPLPLDNSSTIR
jgi:hypothetical protein